MTQETVKVVVAKSSRRSPEHAYTISLLFLLQTSTRTHLKQATHIISNPLIPWVASQEAAYLVSWHDDVHYKSSFINIHDINHLNTGWFAKVLFQCLSICFEPFTLLVFNLNDTVCKHLGDLEWP